MKLGVSTQSGKGAGKTTLAAICGLWFLVCFPYCRIPVMGPKYEQIKSNLWAEIAKWIRHASKVYGQKCLLNDILEMQGDKIFCKHADEKSRGKEWIMHILTFPKNSGIEEQKAAIQGIHNPYLLFLLDEAPGIPEHIFEPIETTLTEPVNLIFMIFNPNKNHGFAIDSQNKGKDQWITHHINVENSGLVSKDHIQRLGDKYGRDSSKYRVSVLGLPPLHEEDALIAWSWIQQAKDRWADYELMDEDVTVMGCDIGGGGDQSIICIRRGPKVIRFLSNNSADTDAVSNWIMKVATEHDPKYIFIDMNGIGHGTYYRVKNMGFPARGINTRRQANQPDRFSMLRDELLWRVREAFESGLIAIPDDDELEGELGLLKYEDDGIIKVVSKKNQAYKREMMARVGYKSPNKTDALTLTYTIPDSSLRNYGMKVVKHSLFDKYRKKDRESARVKRSWMSF